MPPTHRAAVEAILAAARAEHAALLAASSPGMRASLPVDATGIAQAIEHLARAGGVSEDLRDAQARAHRSNPAVLHGRVFGRAPLPRDTVLAAFAEGARVRAHLLVRLAAAIGGTALADDVRELLDGDAPEADGVAALRRTYAAQEHAARHIAAHLDGDRRP